MSYMLIILVIFFIMKGNNNNLLDFIKNVDLSSILPYLEMLGIDKKVVETISSEDFQKVLSGSFDVKTLLPLVMPILQNFIFSKQSATTQSYESEKQAYSTDIQGISPIKDVASDEVVSMFSDYFNS